MPVESSAKNDGKDDYDLNDELLRIYLVTVKRPNETHDHRCFKISCEEGVTILDMLVYS